MDNWALAKILERIAKKDMFDGVGRILIPDLNDSLREPVTAEQILAVWTEYYPCWRIEQRTKNIILVFFDEPYESDRSQRLPIINQPVLLDEE